MNALRFVAALTLAALPALQAQTEPSKPGRCFRPAPLPRCDSFWIYEIEIGQPLLTTGRTVRYTFPQAPGETSFHADDVDRFSVWHLGMMKNTDSLSAVGGTFDIGFSGIGVRAGASVRKRKWLANDFAIEASGGPVLMNIRSDNEVSEHLLRVGLTGGLAVSHHDLVALTLRGDVVPSSKTAAALYGGGELRSSLGLVGTGVGIVLLALLIAAFSDPNY